ncbi:MAG: DHA2 family efflux MFS transporter permease subunit [Novosphingobium sp.]
MATAPAASTAFPRNRQVIAGFVLALSNFMVVLDLTIANVSVPHIAGNLGITLEQGTWIITSYAVAEAICVPLTGWLAMRFGAVRVFVLSMLGFGLFSLLCGMSVTLGMLVACRVGQGICGAPLMPMSQTLMLQVFPPERRGTAMGVWAMTTMLGPAVGPIVGGYISDNISWHWIFLINIPIAVACTIAAYVLLKPIENQTRKVPIDRVGLLLLVFWIGCLQIMLDIGRDRDWFGDPTIVMLAIGAAVGFLAFVIWELTDEHPVVDLRVFRHRGFSSGVVTLALCFGAYFASIVVIPQWLQTSLGYTATKAGLVTAFTALMGLTTAQIVAKLISRVDARIMISAAVAWLGVMSLVRTGWTSGADFWTLSRPQIIQGFAMPFFIIPTTALSLNAVLPHETASAAGLQNFLRTMAVAVATSLSLTVWGDAQRVAHNELANVIQPEATMATLNRGGMGTEQARQVVDLIVTREAITVAVTHTFLVCAIVLFIAAAVVWISPRPKLTPGGPPAH